MEIEVLDLMKLKWKKFKYMMIPPRYGFNTIKIDSKKMLIVGGVNRCQIFTDFMVMDLNLIEENEQFARSFG